MSLRTTDRFPADLVPHKETPRMISRLRLLCVLSFALCACVLASAASAAAAPAMKVWTQTPDYVTPGKGMRVYVAVQNIGSDAMSGDLTLKYTFPEGIPPVDPFTERGIPPNPTCNTVGQLLECSVDVTSLLPGMQAVFVNEIVVDSNASGVLSGGQLEVAGGGAAGTYVEPLSFVVGEPGPFGIESFEVEMSDAPSGPPTQAGSAPGEVTTTVNLPSVAHEQLEPPFPLPFVWTTAPTESFRDVIGHVPPGFVGDPSATPLRCTITQLQTKGHGNTSTPQCPPESQVGLVQLMSGEMVALYNMVPPPGVPASFGFSFSNISIQIHTRVRPSDNGIDLVTERAPNAVPVPKFAITIWGVPGDPSHNPLRGRCLQGENGYEPEQGDCSLHTARVPFLRTPTSCPGTPLGWGLEMNTWQHPGVFHGKETTTPATEGCESLPFDPSISLSATQRSAHTPSGFDVDLTMPQETGPDGLAQADLRSATVTLPQGVTINPASADGLAACSDAQLRLGLAGPSNCPDGSKVGSIELTTPLLEDPIGGSVILRSQASSDPASGDLYRLAIEIRSDERGVAIRLPGSLRVDPDSGQLTTSFDELPQLPFESMRLHLNSGPRAPLTTPSTCGDYTTHAVLTGWNGAVETDESTFTVDENCVAAGFAPGFQAGAENNTAGGFSPFTLRVTREAGQANLSRIVATLPEGELAKLAGVPVCPDAQAASGDCAEGSRIGRVVAAIGEGSSPLYLPQAGKGATAVYLAGPYGGAPYSVLTEAPAQAGPFDLGSVLVRSALNVDPETTRVTVASDPLPQIFGGIPIAYRDVRVEIDRPEFTVNPTDCGPAKVTGTITSAAGDSAAVSDRFQVGECAALGFKPKLSLHLRGQTRRTGHPALTAVLKMPKGGANVARASVALPHSEFLASSHLGTSCTRVQYNAGGGGGEACPKGSVYGRARAFSPLLDKPLEGPVYLRSNGGERELPDLVASLDGQIHVDLVGYVDTDKKTEGLRTTFAHVPDAPVTKFVLKMPGGRKSLLENSTNICRGEHRAVVKMDSQNGRIRAFRPLMRVKCGKGARGH